MKLMTPPPTTTWLYVLRAPTVAAAMWPVGLWANKRKREGSILVATDGGTSAHPTESRRARGRRTHRMIRGGAAAAATAERLLNSLRLTT